MRYALLFKRSSYICNACFSSLKGEWLAKYETLADMVVPRSSKLIKEDGDYCLFTVTLFIKVVEEYKLHCREHKFIVRDFVYDEGVLSASKNELAKLSLNKKKQFGPLVRWLKVNFSEAFTAWIHVKALRVFTESVLRYGLPVNFQAMLLLPNKKTTRKLRQTLQELYNHLDTSASAGPTETIDIPGLGIASSEYFPYVYYNLKIDFVEQKK